MLKIELALWQMGGYDLRANWQIKAGAKLAVIGPSGAGKSTLLLGISGHLPPQSGAVFWQDQDIYRQSLRPASMLFQDQNLFAHLTLLQNVVFGLTAGRRATADQLNQAEAALARVGLRGLGHRKPAQVSGGQMGRAALARVMLQSRPLLLLDEPFAALGPTLRAEMLDLITELAAQTNATVMLVSHDPPEALRFADYVVFVDEGLAAPPVPCDVFLANPPQAYRRYAL